MYKKFGLLFCFFICGSCIPIVDNGEEPADLSTLDLPDGAVGPGELNVLANLRCTVFVPDKDTMGTSNANIPIGMASSETKIELTSSVNPATNVCDKNPGGKILGLSCDVNKESLKQFTKIRPYIITIQQNVLLPANISNTDFTGVSGKISLTLIPSQGTQIVINTNPSQSAYASGFFSGLPKTSNVSLLTPPVDLSMADLKVEFTAIVVCSGLNSLLKPQMMKWDIELLKLTPL